MGIFSRIFGIRKINNISSDLDKKQNDNIVELLELKSFLDELLKKNQYISKREFLSSVDKKKDVLHFFDVLIQSQMLENFCKSNRQSVQEITAALDECNKINDIIDFHNEQYIKQALINEREYFDSILKKVDKNILLDEDQRRVILTDEDSRCCSPRCCSIWCSRPRCCSIRCCSPRCCSIRCCSPRCCSIRRSSPQCCSDPCNSFQY